MNKLQGKTIAVIDDTESIRRFLRIFLESEQAIVHEAANAESGLDVCQRVQPDMVVLDLGLPDRDGLDILPELKQKLPETEVIVLTVRKELVFRQRAFQAGASAYQTKPFMMDELLDVMRDIVLRKNMASPTH